MAVTTSSIEGRYRCFSCSAGPITSATQAGRWPPSITTRGVTRSHVFTGAAREPREGRAQPGRCKVNNANASRAVEVNAAHIAAAVNTASPVLVCCVFVRRTHTLIARTPPEGPFSRFYATINCEHSLTFTLVSYIDPSVGAAKARRRSAGRISDGRCYLGRHSTL